MTIAEFLRMPLEDRMKVAGTQKINRIIIDGNEFRGYKAFSFFYEKTYPKSPERSQGGVIDLSSHSFFLTPHLKIDYSMISYDDWRKITRLILSKNEFVVQCCDIIFGGLDDNSTFKMYFAPDQLPKLQTMARAFNGEKWIEVIGIRDYTIELIGTNSSLDTTEVIYHFNPPKESGLADKIQTQGDVVVGSEVVLKSSFSDEKISGYRFKNWSTSPDEQYDAIYFSDNSVTTVNSMSGLTLYANWERSDLFRLNYSYGLGSPKSDSTGAPILVKQIKNGEVIGALPDSTELPKVFYKGTTFDGARSPYERDGWYQTPTKGTGSTKLTESTKFWADHDVIIYQLFTVKSYTITFNSNGGTEVENLTAKFNESIALPRISKEGVTFKGWYLDKELKEQFIGIMPPVDITLYAKWSDK